jgi:hypothetical protein
VGDTFQPYTVTIISIKSSCDPTVRHQLCSLDLFGSCCQSQVLVVESFLFGEYCAASHTTTPLCLTQGDSVVHSHVLVTSQQHPIGISTPHTQFSSTQLPAVCSFYRHVICGECSTRFEGDWSPEHSGELARYMHRPCYALPLLVPQRRGSKCSDGTSVTCRLDNAIVCSWPIPMTTLYETVHMVFLVKISHRSYLNT